MGNHGNYSITRSPDDLMFLIDDLLLAPFKGFSFIMNTLRKVAEEQWTDDAPLKEQLLELQVQLEDGTLTEDQYLEAEAAILREIRKVQRRKIELAGGDPDALAGGLSGQVEEGSRAEITWNPEESNER
jgi:cytochrome c-type biogenesis protein CcmH/NrfG